MLEEGDLKKSDGVASAQIGDKRHRAFNNRCLDIMGAWTHLREELLELI
jgi:hypothetical protein